MRSKVLPEGITIHRAELMAASMNAATGCTVKMAFGKYHKRALKLSDSMVALHWIGSKRTILKTWDRNRIIEINRMSDASNWMYVESSNMVADLATRKKAKIVDVMEGSNWINGFTWMRKREDKFPTLTMEKIKLNKTDSEEAEIEKITPENFYCHYSADDNTRIDNYSADDNTRIDNYSADDNTRIDNCSADDNTRIDNYSADDNTRIDNYSADDNTRIDNCSADDNTRIDNCSADDNTRIDNYSADDNTRIDNYSADDNTRIDNCSADDNTRIDKEIELRYRFSNYHSK